MIEMIKLKSNYKSKTIALASLHCDIVIVSCYCYGGLLATPLHVHYHYVALALAGVDK